MGMIPIWELRAGVSHRHIPKPAPLTGPFFWPPSISHRRFSPATIQLKKEEHEFCHRQSPVAPCRALAGAGPPSGGGYAFCWGFVALGVAGLYALGMAFHDAEHLSSILAFLIYVAVFLWAFAARSLVRAWVVLLGGGAVMAGAASLIQLMLLP